MAPSQILVNRFGHSVGPNSSVRDGGLGAGWQCAPRRLSPEEKFRMLIRTFLPAHLESFTPNRDGKSTQNREIAP